MAVMVEQSTAVLSQDPSVSPLNYRRYINNFIYLSIYLSIAPTAEVQAPTVEVQLDRRTSSRHRTSTSNSPFHSIRFTNITVNITVKSKADIAFNYRTDVCHG